MKMKCKISLSLLLYFLPFALLAGTTILGCPELTGFQVFAGYFTLPNIFGLLSIIGVVSSVCYLFREYVDRLILLFANIPKEIYEIFAYVISAGLITVGAFLSKENALWFGLTGCLFFAGAIVFSGYIRHLKKNEVRFFSILFIVWSAVAVVYGSSVIGFIAIGALISLIRFSIWISPLCNILGFKDDSVLGKETFSAFVVLSLFVGFHIAERIVHFVPIFENGAFWLGGFGMFSGLLIASTKRHEQRFPYKRMQVIAIISGLIGLYFGSAYDIAVLREMSGTFFTIYLIAKPFDFPIESRTARAIRILLVSLIIGVGSWWGLGHMDILGPYLLF
ncbi:MAG: hypothetical protein WC878_04510 [Candidatus Paceibacterota bacterium]|jgi:hypothetical protein